MRGGSPRLKRFPGVDCLCLLLLLLVLLLVVGEPFRRLLSVSLDPLDIGFKSLNGLLDGSLGTRMCVTVEEGANFGQQLTRRKVAALTRDATQ